MFLALGVDGRATKKTNMAHHRLAVRDEVGKGGIKVPGDQVGVIRVGEVQVMGRGGTDRAQWEFHAGVTTPEDEPLRLVPRMNSRRRLRQAKWIPAGALEKQLRSETAVVISKRHSWQRKISSPITVR